MNKETQVTSKIEYGAPGGVLGHPDDVVRHPRMTLAEKRAVLAAWASDAHAVEDAPGLRQLDDGSLVAVDERSCRRCGRSTPQLAAAIGWNGLNPSPGVAERSCRGSEKCPDGGMTMTILLPVRR